MRVEITSAEALALYCLLRDAVGSGCEEDAAFVSLQGRLSRCIIDAIDGEPVRKHDRAEAVMRNEQEKINDLRRKLDNVKQEQGELAGFALRNFVLDAGDDMGVPEYPRRSPRASTHNRSRGRQR